MTRQHRRGTQLTVFARSCVAVTAIPPMVASTPALADSAAHDIGSFLTNHPNISALLGAALLALIVAVAAFGLQYRISRQNIVALKHTNDRLSGFIESTSDWAWETDDQVRLTYISPQFTEQTGVPAEDLLGESPREVFIKDQPELYERHSKRIAAHEEFHDIIYEFLAPNGSRNWYQTSGIPQFNETGVFTGYLGTTRNITEEITHKRELEENLAATTYLFEATPDAIAFALPDRRIVKINKRFTELFGYSADDIYGKTTEMLFADRTDYEESGRRTFNLESKEHFEPHSWKLQRKDGSTFTAEVVGSRVFNSDGVAIGNVGLLRDVTERENTNITLRKAKETAEFANRSKSQFLAHMSHELRTPLNAIMGFAEILQLEMHGVLGDERYRNYVGDIHTSGSLLLSMINDVLDLAKIEAGKLDLDERDLEIDPLLEDSLRFLKEQATQRGITIRTSNSTDGVTLFADERLVKQMLINLLSNAVKFTPPEGTIRIFVTQDENGDLRISIADTGVGIATEDIERVRRPFAQVHNVWQKSDEGTGIGLYLVESLVQAHEGSMYIASELGNGTIVTLRFPAARIRANADGQDLRDAG